MRVVQAVLIFVAVSVASCELHVLHNDGKVDYEEMSLVLAISVERTFLCFVYYRCCRMSALALAPRDIGRNVRLRGCL